MKNLTLFLLLLTSILMTGCGVGQKTSAKLEVSQGFLVTAAGFEGGLIIYGKNLSTGQSFNIDLASGLSFSLDLPKGVWTFSAVGWDGGVPVKNFGGTPSCGIVTKELKAETENIGLSVTNAGCADPYFTGGAAYLDVGPQTFKRLNHISTCGSLFNGEVLPSTTLAAAAITGATSMNYCDSLSDDLRTKSKSLRIFAVHKPSLAGGPTDGFASPCLANDSNSSVIDLYGAAKPYNGNALKLPYGNMPFIIKTYSDSACADVMADYKFMDGLLADTSGDFDKVLIPDLANEVKLILPGTDSRRGFSPLMAIMPDIRCWTGVAYTKCPTVTGTSPGDYRGYTGSHPNNKIYLPDATCNTIARTGYVLSGTCVDNLSGGATITFVGAGSAGSGTITMNSSTYSVAISADAAFDLDRDYVSNVLISSMGSSQPLIPDTFYGVGEKNHDRKFYGELSLAREMFSPIAAGGIFRMPAGGNFQTACQSLSGSFTESRFDWDDLQTKTHRVEISNVATSPGSFFCDLGNLDQGTCVDQHEKRMKIYDLNQNPMLPVIVMEFNCGKKIGKMEVNEVDQKGYYRHTNNMLIAWNTDLAGNSISQRYDFAKKSVKEELILSTWTTTGKFLEMGRTFKSNYKEVATWNYRFHSQKNASVWDQHLDSIQTINLQSLPSKHCFDRVMDPGLSHVNPSQLLSTSIYLGLPHSESIGSYRFDSGAIYPQASVTTTGCAAFPTIPSGLGNQILGSLAFELGALIDVYSATFGGPFYTN